MLKRPVVTATDEHDIPAMFKKINEKCMVAGISKGGISKHLRYTTAKIMGGSIGVTVAAYPTGKNYKRPEL